MSDTIRPWSDIAALLADNTNRNISPQKIRDALYSMRCWGAIYMNSGGTTATTPAASPNWTTLDFADWSNDANSIGVTPDKANDRLILPVHGLYLVQASISAKVSSAIVSYSLKSQLDGSDIPGAYCSLFRVNSTAAYAPTNLVGVANFTSGNGYVSIVAQGNGAITIIPEAGCVVVRKIA